MTNPLISIIVPCYNQAQYLDECLQSVLDQTYQNWECIIVNDSSPDNTEEVAMRWVDKDTRFNYLYKENGGVASARNLGINIAKGEWILPLDGDDKINEDYLLLSEKYFSDDVDLIYCNASFFGDLEESWELQNFTYTDLLKSNMIFCTAFYKKESWLKTEGYDNQLVFGYEDWEFWISLLNEDSKVIKLDYLGFYYRRKQVSRDVFVNEDIDKKITSFNYIYSKHLSKYMYYDKNAISNYKMLSQKLDHLNIIYQHINKNFITRMLYKLIKQFS